MNDHDKHDDDKAAADEETEIAWHRKQIAENSSILHELEAGNQSGGEVFPETQNEIDHLRDQIAQSELIVAAYEKKNPSSA